MNVGEMPLKERIMLLENAVLNDSPEEVRALYRQLGEVDYSARALGLACRFRGAEMVKALVESGASFHYKEKEKIYGYPFMKIWHGEMVNGYYYTALWSDFSLMLLEPLRTIIVLGTEPADYSDEYGYINKAEDGGVLPLSERLTVLGYLCDCGVDIGFDRDNVFYYSILTDCAEFYSALKERCAALPEKIHASLVKGGAGWDAFSAILHYAPPEFFPRAIERLAAELSPDEKIRYNDNFFEIHKNLLTVPKNLELVINHFDCSKMNQTKTLKFLIDIDAVGCLPLLEKAGWLKLNRRRDELIQYAVNGGRTETAAWLMDFKNRTADFAKERERAEKKMQRELNAAPDSVTSLKQIWGYTKLNDGTLRITNYKGGRTEVTVPEKIGGSRVTAIGKSAFSGNIYDASRADPKQVEFRRSITKIILPEGITTIGNAAFSNIEKMRYAELPASVCDVGEFAFTCCDGLERIIFTGKTLTLGDYALSNCENLKEVIFAEGTEKIELGWFVFENCENLQKLVLPSTLKEIKIDEEDFLEDCPDACAIVRRGSFAEDYCKKHKIEFQYSEEP